MGLTGLVCDNRQMVSSDCLLGPHNRQGKDSLTHRWEISVLGSRNKSGTGVDVAANLQRRLQLNKIGCEKTRGTIGEDSMRGKNL